MGTDRKKRNIRINKTKLREKEDNSQESSGGVSKLQLINGTRKRRRIIRITAYAAVAAVIIALIIVNALTPTGLIEAMQNGYAKWGSGDFPITVYGSNASSFSSKNGVVSVLNDSFFEIYNTDGKLMQAVSHGMSEPAFEQSESRFLLYDRNRYTASVFNYSDKLYSLEFDKKISSGAIGCDGTFALITDSDTYCNTVYVYNKDNEKVYTWNSANYYVVDVAVSRDGEGIAVCLLGSQGGYFESYVYILKFNSAEPVFTYKFSDIVSSLTVCGENYILANGFDRAYTVSWSGKAPADIGVNGDVRCFDSETGGTSCVVYGRSDNESSNKVTVINSEGNITASFDFASVVADVAVSDSEIAVLSGNEVYVYSHSGALKATVPTEVKANFLGLDGDNGILLLDSLKLSKVNY